MIIKTLTTYDVYNYGASLQAFALLKYLKGKGHDAQIIRYQPVYLSRKYDYKWVNPESRMSKYAVTRFVYRIGKFIQRQTTLGRKRMFDFFNHHVLDETETLYTTFDELKSNPPKADLYICGSDQIWNVLYDAGRDPAFYLDFAPEGRKKGSYAASFSYLNIDEENKKRICNSLTSFDAVSVREYHGINILETMGIKGEWVLDPVFLINSSDWKDFASKGKYDINPNEDFLLLYDFEGNPLLKRCAINYAKEKKLKIYAIVDTYGLRYADKNFSDAGPYEFVQLINNCKAFISNSFHGTAFSIIFHKPFFVFNRNRHPVNSRMESLTKLFHLEDCIIDTKEKENGMTSKSFDWIMIDEKKKEMIERSKAFLQKLCDR